MGDGQPSDSDDARDAAPDGDAPTVLVTGATGTVGEQVLAHLPTDEVAVRAGVRDPADDPGDTDDTDERPEGVDPVRFDYTKPETWGFAFAGVDRMFLLRPPGSVSLSTVVDAVDAAVRSGVDHVVYLSVLGAEKMPVLPHRRIERHLEASAADHTFLRAAFFMQNLAEVHRPEVVERDEIFVPAGDGRTSFVDARDVGAVAAAALTEPGHRNRAYDVTGRDVLDYDEVAAVFSDVLGREITYADPSVVAFVRRLVARGVPLGFAVAMVGIYAPTRFGLATRTSDDAARILGREPHTMREFVADYAAAFEPESY